MGSGELSFLGLAKSVPHSKTGQLLPRDATHTICSELRVSSSFPGPESPEWLFVVLPITSRGATAQGSRKKSRNVRGCVLCSRFILG